MFSLLLGLCFSAFLSATLLPIPSELSLLTFVQHYPDEVVWALVSATLGNVLGSLSSYCLGRFVPNQVKKKNWGMNFINRFGAWALLLAWLPVCGDVLPLLAGYLRLPVLICIIMITLGKFARYLMVLCLFY